MSLNGLVHPFREKCESANWRWVRAHQLMPQGLGPIMDQQNRCDYYDSAPYIDPKVMQELHNYNVLRASGYPNVTMFGKMGPLLYRGKPPASTCGKQVPYTPGTLPPSYCSVYNKTV
jgi:hypothetical protein